MTRRPIPTRVNVTLDELHAEKLRRLAERTHVNEGTIARSLLSSALDEADPRSAERDSASRRYLGRVRACRAGPCPGASRRGEAAQRAVVARVLVAPAASADLTRMITTHSLPTDTRDRVRRSIEPLARFPLLGALLEGGWERYRFVLGPWRWMVIVCAYDVETDVVTVATIQDGRTSAAATAAD
jgi:hypothetical protein